MNDFLTMTTVSRTETRANHIAQFPTLIFTIHRRKLGQFGIKFPSNNELNSETVMKKPYQHNITKSNDKIATFF